MAAHNQPATLAFTEKSTVVVTTNANGSQTVHNTECSTADHTAGDASTEFLGTCLKCFFI